ncbi:MAG: dUTP diphosphatase [Alphaproteobacteria bacterium]|nr:dUTP diphosphatase [Alphaproteobacteria bacterium]
MTSFPSVSVKRLPHNPNLPLPAYETAGAAGMDLRAALDGPVVLKPGERAAIPTGLVFAIPNGWEGQIRPRSGLAARQGVTVVNAPGTIDSDYRGEVKVLLVNLGNETVTFEPGDRVAQMVFAPAPQLLLNEVDELPETSRNASGFGSTGLK